MEEIIKCEMKFEKANKDLGVLYGWLSVSTVNGEKVVDSYGDYVSMKELAKAALDFVENSRVCNLDHTDQDVGEFPFIMPIYKGMESMGIKCDKEGILGAFEPTDPAMIEAFEKGEFSGFSFEGTGYRKKVE